MPANFAPTSLDHVALWVDEREPLATFLCDHLGMHVIEETDTFTLVGIDAKLGKLTLFDADGPRQRGALEPRGAAGGRAGRRARGAALRGRPAFRRRRRIRGAGGAARSGSSRRPGRTSTSTTWCSASRIRRPRSSCFEELGFERRPDGSVAVDDRYVRVVRGTAADGGRPLLNHLALLVDDAHGVQDEAEGAGLEIDDVKDAKNTFAVFVRGPEGVRVEYVEHKPGFALV